MDKRLRLTGFRIRKGLASVGLLNYGGDENVPLGQVEDIDFLRILDGPHRMAEMDMDGMVSPKIRLDLVEFELRHLKVNQRD